MELVEELPAKHLLGRLMPTNYTHKKSRARPGARDKNNEGRIAAYFTSTIFTLNAPEGADTSTFPNFPAEIRAPRGTLAGVSGFQMKFGSTEVFTPGDYYDVLVVMNAAALKANLSNLKTGGVIVANTEGFDKKKNRILFS